MLVCSRRLFFILLFFIYLSFSFSFFFFFFIYFFFLSVKIKFQFAKPYFHRKKEEKTHFMMSSAATEFYSLRVCLCVCGFTCGVCPILICSSSLLFFSFSFFFLFLFFFLFFFLEPISRRI